MEGLETHPKPVESPEQQNAGVDCQYFREHLRGTRSPRMIRLGYRSTTRHPQPMNRSPTAIQTHSTIQSKSVCAVAWSYIAVATADLID